MPRPETDRNLLFGIIALQMDFITRDALVAAMNAWVLEKHRPLGEILVERGALDPTDRALLDPMVDRHVVNHGGNPAASLAAVSSIESVADELRQKVTEPEVLASIALFSTESQRDPHATRAPQTTEFKRGEASDSVTQNASGSQADSHATPAHQTGDLLPAGVRYRKVRDHASGGLGIVFVARDQELNRDVALKEIKASYADNPTSQARFLLEAEITGGLEHPGIVPVYGLGHYEDGRPFYAMRFIRGDSLKDAITAFHNDPNLKKDQGARTLALQKLLRRFLDVCNAIAYAHSRGILHRDLKPDNVMVGRYGETLVVDWGLAKALGRSGEDDRPSPLESTFLSPSSSGSAETLPGSVIGTPGYMSPEQASGRLDLLGPASDVYSLGATLYTLLTGQVPFVDKDIREVLRKVERGEFPRPREAAPWLDPALEAICLKAMALSTEARYASPRALAEEIERWLADEPVAAYREPLSRRARRWAGRNRTALATTVSAGLVAIVLLSGFAWQRISQRQQTDTSARAVLEQAERIAIDARLSGKPADWIKAVAEARRAVDQLETGGGSISLLREAKARRDALQAEEVMVAALDEARLQNANVKGGSFDETAKLDSYLAAFRAYGLDLAVLPVEDAVQRIRSSRIADHLISALDDWAAYKPENVPGSRLEAIARAAETDPERGSIRDLFLGRDSAGLRRLCETKEARRKLGPRLRYIYESLLILDPAGNLALLDTILRENPSDFWLNHDLGKAYQRVGATRSQESLRYLTVAVALKPDSAGAHYDLGYVLYRQGKLDEAIAAFREAIRINPDLAWAHYNMGYALEDQDKPDEAIAAYREAIRVKPDYFKAHYNLGLVLLNNQGKHEAAIPEFREAIRLNPAYDEAHTSLGLALVAQGKIDEAIAAYRQAILVKPGAANAHSNLGNALKDQGKLDEAIAEYLEAIRLKPDNAANHYNLGSVLKDQKRFAESLAAQREAIRLKPDFFQAHNSLGNLLSNQGKIDEAIAAYREAIRIKPDYILAHCNLGQMLVTKGLFREGLESLEQAHKFASRQPGSRVNTEAMVRNARRLVDLEAKIPVVLKGGASPKDNDERLAMADLCYKKGLQAASVRFWDEAFTEQPALLNDLAKGHRYNAACAASLAGSGSGKDDPAPDEAARVKFREKALGWLRADLASWDKVLAGGNESGRKQAVSQTLAHWKEDTDLAGIRDETALLKLTESEREAFRTLWADVDRLLAKTRSGI